VSAPVVESQQNHPFSKPPVVKETSEAGSFWSGQLLKPAVKPAAKPPVVQAVFEPVDQLTNQQVSEPVLQQVSSQVSSQVSRKFPSSFGELFQQFPKGVSSSFPISWWTC
jgi:hypothetical protein